MKRALLLVLPLLLLGGCVVAEPVPPPPPPPPARPPPPPPPPARRVISEREALDIAFDFVKSRGADVHRVKYARLDDGGRWHVELHGERGDRAQVVVDGGSGRVLRARIHDHDRHRDDGDRY